MLRLLASELDACDSMLRSLLLLPGREPAPEALVTLPPGPWIIIIEPDIVWAMMLPMWSVRVKMIWNPCCSAWCP